MLNINMCNSLLMPWELGKWENFERYGTGEGLDGRLGFGKADLEADSQGKQSG